MNAAQLLTGQAATLDALAAPGRGAVPVRRAHRWHGKDSDLCEKAFIRALELLDLTIGDDRWKGRRKELTRVRELLCDAMEGGSAYGSNLASLDRYFLHFAVAARAGR